MTVPVPPAPPDVTVTAAEAASFFFQLSFFSRGGFNFNIGFGVITGPTGHFEPGLATSSSYDRFWGIVVGADNAGARACVGAAAGDGDRVGAVGGAAGLGTVVLS